MKAAHQGVPVANLPSGDAPSPLATIFGGRQATAQAEPARAQPSKKDDLDSWLIDKLFNLIENNFRSHRVLNFYAAKLTMSSDCLNKHVKRLTGVTAGQLIRQRVLTEAKRQLAFSNQPISEIAYDLAYADPSHFVRCFRRDTGVTPRTFREKAGRLI